MDRRIKVFCAEASTGYIRFYSNKAPNWYCEGKIIDDTHASIEWKKKETVEQEKTIAHKTSLLEIIIAKLKGLKSLFYVLKLSKTLIKIFMFFFIFLGILLYRGYTNFTILFLTVGLASLIGEISMFAVEFSMEYKLNKRNKRSKHTAEHKLANILEKLQRLPNNFDEIEQMTRFSKDCGNKEKKKIYEDYAKGILGAIFYVLISIVVFIQRKMEISVLDILCFSVIHFLLEVIFLKPLSLLINMLFQVASTTRKPDENDLMLAWIVAKEWMKEEYPEYFQED